MPETKQLHVYVDCVEPRVLRVFFCASNRLDNVDVCEERLASRVRRELNRPEFEAAALQRGEDFLEHAGVIEVTEDGEVNYDIQEAPEKPVQVAEVA